MDSLFLHEINIIQLVILVVGMVLVIVEMFHPGFGLPGILGGTFIIVGILILAKTFWEAVIIICVVLTILGIALGIVLRSFAKNSYFKKIILKDETDNASLTNENDFKAFIGKQGKSITMLRPAGIADFDEVRLDVVSEGDFIESGTKIMVVEVKDLKVIVKKI